MTKYKTTIKRKICRGLIHTRKKYENNYDKKGFHRFVRAEFSLLLWTAMQHHVRLNKNHFERDNLLISKRKTELKKL